MRLCHPQMAVPVPSRRCCVLNHHNLFYPIQNALAFNWDTCCHLALCLQMGKTTGTDLKICVFNFNVEKSQTDQY